MTIHFGTSCAGQAAQRGAWRKAGLQGCGYQGATAAGDAEAKAG